MAMNSAHCHEFNFSQPAATHRGSPIQGSQASNNIGLPKLFTRCMTLAEIALARCGKNRPIQYELMPPSVLPAVAATSACQKLCGSILRYPNNANSDGTGKMEPAAKLTKNRLSREVLILDTLCLEQRKLAIHAERNFELR